MKYLGHRNPKSGREQLLLDHLRGVSEKAGKFAAAFGEESVGQLIGLYHDIGKYSTEFQNYLQQGGGRKVDHSTAGALELWKRKISGEGAFCVAGHHAGLPDGGSKVSTSENKTFLGRMKKKEGADIPVYQAYREEGEWLHKASLSPILSQIGKDDRFARQFYMRMLFSCLVDADFLDTEDFMREDAGKRGEFDAVNVLKERLDSYVEEKFLDERGERYAEPINQRRRKILKECIKAGESGDEQSLWSLTVPTGGGKTIASLSFALHHAVSTGKKRVIYVIPYTSIIEQNAKIFRDILGDENVVEHHSNVEYDSPDIEEETGHTEEYEKRKKLQWAAENWDAPLIVTTNVQFFESLFSNRTSKCRKLHNICNSVIIFDEAQMLPIGFLRPCIAAIHELTYRYHVAAVLCTATQPSLDKFFAQDYRREVREICQGTAENYDFFRRSKIEVLKNKVQVGELAERLGRNLQVLCIVNTKKTARLLFEEMKEEEGVFYLSTNLCPVHRAEVIEKIKALLKEKSRNKPCRVISTSLIEAGVDVDFPCVYREFAGLDSIIQAAGRCNREGISAPEKSITYVFAWSDSSLDCLPHAVRPCRDAAKAVCEKHMERLDSPKVMQNYFDLLHHLKDSAGLDREGIMGMIQKETYPFEKLAKKFVLIENKTKSVFIPWNDRGKEIERRLRGGERSRKLMRMAGRYMVNVYYGTLTSPFEKMLAAQWIELLDESVAILINHKGYDRHVGLKQEIEDGQSIML